MKYILYINFLLFLVGCTSPIKQKNEGIVNQHIQTIISQLEDNNIGLIKYLNKSGKEDTLKIESVNWKKELSIFINNDIKPNNLTKYNVVDDKQKSTVTYISKDESNKIKFLNIKFNNEIVETIKISIVNQENIYDIKYELEINRKNGFLIEAQHQVDYLYKDDFRVEGKFFKK